MELLINTVKAADETINLKNVGTDFSTLTTLTIGGIIGGLIRLSLIIAAIVFFAVLIIGGIRWIVSGGDKGATEEARNQITAALIGLVIVFGAWAILQLIGTFFDINIFELKLPTAK